MENQLSEYLKKNPKHMNAPACVVAVLMEYDLNGQESSQKLFSEYLVLKK